MLTYQHTSDCQVYIYRTEHNLYFDNNIRSCINNDIIVKCHASLYERTRFIGTCLCNMTIHPSTCCCNAEEQNTYTTDYK